MYFWRIKRLKDLLIQGPLPEKSAFLYLFLYLFFATLLHETAPETGTSNFWDYLDTFIAIVCTGLGIVYVYIRNGGSNGSYFMQRFISIGWVLAVRLTVMLLLPLIAAVIFIESLLHYHTIGTDCYDPILTILLNVFYYWRFGVHVSEVAKAAPSISIKTG